MNITVEKQLVRAPLASAHHFISAFLSEHSAPNGFGSRVYLHAGAAAQAAIVRIRPIHRPGDMTPRFSVRWESADGGPYPVFAGELHVEADEDYNTFYLTIDGGYAPPGGAVGVVFDAAIGQHVAVAAARDLLRQISTEIEALFAVAERTKVGSTHAIPSAVEGQPQLR